MEKQDKPSLEVKFFELVLKAQLERAIGAVFEQAIHQEMPEVFDSLSLDEQKEFDQKALALIEKVFPEIIRNLRNRISVLAQGYEEISNKLRKTDPFAN